MVSSSYFLSAAALHPGSFPEKREGAWVQGYAAPCGHMLSEAIDKITTQGSERQIMWGPLNHGLY